MMDGGCSASWEDRLNGWDAESPEERLKRLNEELAETQRQMLETTDKQERKELRRRCRRLDLMLGDEHESYREYLSTCSDVSPRTPPGSPGARRNKIFPIILQLIHALDSDSDGFISKEEFEKLPGLPPMSDDAWAEMVVQSDLNKDGKVSVQEMAEFTFSSQASENPPEEDEAWIYDLKLMLHALGAPDDFSLQETRGSPRSRSNSRLVRSSLYPLIERLLHMADTNGDGVLSKEEFEHHTARVMSDEEWAAVKELVDTDGDGEVSVGEMAEFVYSDAVNRDDFDLEKEMQAFTEKLRDMGASEQEVADLSRKVVLRGGGKGRGRGHPANGLVPRGHMGRGAGKGGHY